MIGTRPTLGVAPSTHCMLYVICSPVGPFFPTRKLSADEPTPKYASQFTAVSLLATESATRAWPGGVGEFKLAGNYAPCFKPQMMALKRGYQQNLWTMHGKLSEAGQMNIFVVFRKGNEVEVATPDLDGTILPGVTVSPSRARRRPGTDPYRLLSATRSSRSCAPTPNRRHAWTSLTSFK